MIGEITKFGDTYATAYRLPEIDPDQDIGSADFGEYNVELPRGGLFDPLGSGPSRPGRKVIQVMGILNASSGSNLLSAAEDLYSMLGRKSKLWKENPYDSEKLWRYARLINIVAGTNVQSIPRNQQAMELFFEVAGPVWKSDSEKNLSGSLSTQYTNVEIENTGTAYVRDVEITVTASGSNITTVYFRYLSDDGDCYFYYSGTISPGQTLTIDTGQMTVLLGSSDAYDGFGFHSSHEIDGWLQIPPKSSDDLRIERVGGDSSSTYTVDYYEAYN